MSRRLLSSGAAGGPLAGVKVLELAGLAIAPHACLLLADFGADVVRVDRPHPPHPPPHYGTAAFGRGKRRLALDLKDAQDRAALQGLAARADVLVEPYRPGVMESLGLGPDALRADNPRLVYARMTGWGQDGPRAPRAGHDINYIAQAGALDMVRDRQSGTPVPPVNLLGDFAGGSLTAAMGIAMALFERERSGQGQVIDAAVLDGSAYLTSFVHKLAGLPGGWRDPPGSNMLDGAAPFYGCYETLDGRHMAVGAIEPQFWDELVGIVFPGDEAADLPAQQDRAAWPVLRARLATAFAAREQDEWTRLFDGSDACVSPVLSREEAASDPHNVTRGVFVDDGGHPMPAPAPRLSRTPAAAAVPSGENGDGVHLHAVEEVGW